MSILPRWYDDFSTDPTSDPAYDIDSWTYNGTDDSMEHTTSGLGTITLLNSNNSFGIAEFDFYWNNDPSVYPDEYMAFRAFGYLIGYGVTGVGSNHYSVFGAWTEEKDPDSFDGSTPRADAMASFGESSTGRHVLRMVSTPNGVDIYLDNFYKGTLPHVVAVRDVAIYGRFWAAHAYALHSLNIKSDASLPKIPTLVEPGIGSGLTDVDGPIIVDIPESRLYLDLGSYAGQIEGLTNVVWDPASLKTGPVAMSENSGVPDRAGDTTGDYYMEIPNREVASDYRLVIKESFVSTNSVAVGDTIGFDVVGGPAGQTALVKEEDDLHCYVDKSRFQSFNDGFNFGTSGLQNYIDERPSNNLILPNADNFALHNINADGNNPYITGRPLANLFDDQYGSTQVQYTSGHSLPIIIDIDLGTIWNLTNLKGPRNGSLVGGTITSMDIYSNTVPFVGSSLAQGTLEVDNHPVNAQHSGVTTLGPYLSGLVPEFSLTTRYLRLVVNNDNILYGDQPTVYCFNQLYFFGTNILEIDSVNDNAQFEHEPAIGGGFGAFPGAGVTQGDGKVRITLPTNMEVASGEANNFFSIKFKPDITD